MSQNSIPAALVGAISGAVSALIVTMLVSPSGTTRSGTAAAGGGALSAGESAESLQALDRLERENQSLELRIASLEARPLASAGRAALEADSSELQATELGAAGASTAARLVGESGSVSQTYYDDFRTASDMYAAEKTAARDEKRRLDREQRNEERLTKLVTQLGLDEYQTGRMRGILGSQDEQRSTMFEAMRGGDGETVSREGIRESMRKIEEEANSAMEAVLTPLQYEDYQSTTRRGFGGGGGNRGGDNRGGGGGRGNG